MASEQARYMRQLAKEPDAVVMIRRNELLALMAKSDDALDGNSNDREHDTLYFVREALSEFVEDPARRVLPSTTAPTEALRQIHVAMSGEQDSDTFNTIEGILTRAGYQVRDINAADEEPETVTCPQCQHEQAPVVASEIGGVITTYHCAICGEEFDAEREQRRRDTALVTALKLMSAILNAGNARDIADLTSAAREISANELRSEVDSLTHDLQVAARRYEECIKELSAGGEEFRAPIFTFEQQAKRARAQADALEGIEEF